MGGGGLGGALRAQSSLPLQQQYWCDSAMYSTLVLVWYIPHVAQGQCRL